MGCQHSKNDCLSDMDIQLNEIVRRTPVNQLRSAFKNWIGKSSPFCPHDTYRERSHAVIRCGERLKMVGQ